MTEIIKALLYLLACVAGSSLVLYLSAAFIGEVVGTIDALMYSRKKRRK